VIVLALDTTTRAGAVAVIVDGAVSWEGTGDPRLTHGERLPRELLTALDGAGIPLASVDLFAVAAGPGSFTGLRVGIAAMQGLAMATGRGIVPVSTLEALALAAAAAAPRLTAAWMDAQRGQVFAALYRDGSADPIEPPSAMTPAETLAHWSSHDLGDAVFIGDGAVRYADVIRGVIPQASRILAPPPLAPIVGRIAAAAPHRAVNPHAVIPIYVRRPDAEIARLTRAKQ
jgi:tRNA threonylcarbamoyladenosine biosynthesis protein TsaB